MYTIDDNDDEGDDWTAISLATSALAQTNQLVAASDPVIFLTVEGSEFPVSGNTDGSTATFDRTILSAGGAWSSDSGGNSL